ncbi:MAG: oligoendopeptidase F [Firmicutes bacterium]|nr:oligoendopeptidase F [Bacillota bacterium]
MKRNEQIIENTWKLEDIFETEQEWKNCLDHLDDLVKKCVSYKDKLNDVNNLLAYLNTWEELSHDLEMCYAYAYLSSDQDAGNGHYLELKGFAQAKWVEISNQCSFFDVQVLQIEEETLNSFYETKPELLKYKRFLDECRRLKEHTLSEAEENLLSLAGQVGQIPDSIFGMLDNADVSFKEAEDKEGIKHDLTHGSFIALMHNSDEVLRKSAFKNLYQFYKSHVNTYASILDGQAQVLKFQATARKYNSSLEASLDANQVPVSVYDNLIDTVHKNIEILHKYMKTRKKVLNKEELHMYDLYVPMVESVNSEISYEQAKEEVLQSVQVYGKDYTSVYEGGLNNRWIDIYENEGKCSGAYSYGVSVHPYVLMNYKETLDSEFTLAHEMGHAMHSYLSNTYQSELDKDYKIFVAEVASTCNEALLMDSLLKKTTDKKERAYLINYFLEQYRTTLYRQTMFAEFEKIIHEKVARNERLTAASLNKIYHDLNAFYYGEDVVVDEEIDYEWARIPHFYMNFYVYQYATGFSAAMALSQKILSGDPQNVVNYLSFLKGGCSKSPIDLLKMAGVDMSSPEPVELALQKFDQLIDEFDALLED